MVDRVIVRGEAGVDIGGNLLHLIGDVGAGEVAEDGHDAVQVLAGALQCFDGVFPCGGGGIISNGGDFGAMALECLVEGGAEVLYLDVCEGRKLVGQRGGSQQWVSHKKLPYLISSALCDGFH